MRCAGVVYHIRSPWLVCVSCKNLSLVQCYAGKSLQGLTKRCRCLVFGYGAFLFPTIPNSFPVIPFHNYFDMNSI